MNENYFEIVLKGTLIDGFDAKAAQENLAKLLRVSPEAVLDLVGGQPRVIKRGIDSATAQIYKDAVERAGAHCEIWRNVPPVENHVHLDAIMTTSVKQGEAVGGSSIAIGRGG